MSEQTLDALDQAIRDHIAADDGGYVTGWVLVVAEAVEDDADRAWYSYHNSDQPVHLTLGLIDMARRWYHRFIEENERR